MSLIDTGSIPAFKTCLPLPSPQSTRYVSLPNVRAMHDTFLRRLGAPDDVPSHVTDMLGVSDGADGAVLAGLNVLGAGAGAFDGAGAGAVDGAGGAYPDAACLEAREAGDASWCWTASADSKAWLAASSSGLTLRPDSKRPFANTDANCSAKADVAAQSSGLPPGP